MEFARPETPCVGAIYRNRRGKSGRLWEVGYRNTWPHILGGNADTWRLFPLPSDPDEPMRMSGIDEDGQTYGGIVPIERLAEQLNDRRKWEVVGFSEKCTTWPVMDRDEIEAAMQLLGYEMGRILVNGEDESEGWLPLYKPRSTHELTHFFDQTMSDLHLSAKGYKEGWLVVPAEVGV